MATTSHFKGRDTPLRLGTVSRASVPLLGSKSVLALPRVGRTGAIGVFATANRRVGCFICTPRVSVTSLPNKFCAMCVLGGTKTRAFIKAVMGWARDGGWV